MFKLQITNPPAGGQVNSNTQMPMTQTKGKRIEGVMGLFR